MTRTIHRDEFDDLRAILTSSGLRREDVEQVLQERMGQEHAPAPRKRRRWLAAAASAAAIAVALIVTPSILTSRGPAAIALGPAEPLTFPLTPTDLPPGLAAPWFERDGDLALAHYQGQGTDQLTIVVRDEAAWDVPRDAERVSVHDTEAVAFGDSEVQQVIWHEGSSWIAVSGRGQFADRSTVLTFASGLENTAQHVEMPLTVAPEGWTPTNYKSIVTVTLADRTGRTLTLVAPDALSADFERAYGVTLIDTPTVSGTQANLGRTGDGDWVLEGTSLAGRHFALLADSDFTQAQLVEIANGVR